MLETLGLAVVAFVSTNLDDVFLLAAFFADPRMRPRAVVAGQFLGIAALTAASAAAAAAALVVPEGWIALLGVVPLALGLGGLWELREGGTEGDTAEDAELREVEHRAERRTGSQALAVAAVTVANGGDNFGVYIPVFARDLAAVPVYAAVFAVMTALLCAAGHRLVHNRAFGAHVRRWGHVILPVVLIALGLWILWGAVPRGS